MKVLLIQTFHYMRGGDSTYTFSLAELLRRHGHEVSFFAMSDLRNLPCEQEEFFVDNIDFAEIAKHKNLSNAVRVLSTSIYSFPARRKLSALLREIRPDVAHIQNIHAHLTPSILHALRDAGVPAVWTLHDYKLICPDSRLLSNGVICESCKGNRFSACVTKRCKKESYAASLVAALEATAHRLIDIPSLVSRFIAPSRFLQNKFGEFGWPTGRIVHVRNFLTDDQFPDVGCEDGGYALYLGQLEPWKGVRTLVAASARLPKIKLLIAGDGSERAGLELRVAEMGHSGISFTGHVERSRLQGLLAGASFVVAPSESYENCPYSVMEAMASGKAVIASNLGGLPELVEDGKTGILVDAANSEQLAGAMDRLSQDASLRRRLGDRARERAIQEFSADRHYDRISALYLEACPAVGSRTSPHDDAEPSDVPGAPPAVFGDQD